MFRPLEAIITFFQKLYEWLHKERNCLSMVRSQHPRGFIIIYCPTRCGCWDLTTDTQLRSLCNHSYSFWKNL